MPIFISYSSTNRDFVDRLAKQLVAHQVHVWLDKWEIHVGDSLITKIQQGITGASGLLIVLSKASVQSEWCRKELNSALMRELEEKRVVVLPVMLEDCEMPMFLREKLYADFRKDFDAGLSTILEAVARVTNEWRARITEPGWHTDSAIDWGKDGEDHIIRITMVEQAKDQPYSVLGVTTIIAKGSAAKWFQAHVERGTDEAARAQVIYDLANAVKDDDDFNVLLKDQREVFRRTVFTIEGHVFRVISSVRWLGMDTGRDVLFRIGGQIEGMADRMREITRQPPKSVKEPVSTIRPKHPDTTPAKPAATQPTTRPTTTAKKKPAKPIKKPVQKSANKPAKKGSKKAR
ncbi:MAG: toll/interleukin-1 receptor domain-containing protein [Planctomycetaceae bacterium]|nr:toll/interleukin-1 receptor domain-containing protein [Planctomycetaceae bacterium]